MTINAKQVIADTLELSEEGATEVLNHLTADQETSSLSRLVQTDPGSEGIVSRLRAMSPAEKRIAWARITQTTLSHNDLALAQSALEAAEKGFNEAIAGLASIFPVPASQPQKPVEIVL